MEDVFGSITSRSRRHAYRGKKLDPTIFEKVNVKAFVVGINVEH
jgi:hypothetical protein